MPDLNFKVSLAICKPDVANLFRWLQSRFGWQIQVLNVQGNTVHWQVAGNDAGLAFQMLRQKAFQENLNALPNEVWPQMHIAAPQEDNLVFTTPLFSRLILQAACSPETIRQRSTILNVFGPVPPQGIVLIRYKPSQGSGNSVANMVEYALL